MRPVVSVIIPIYNVAPYLEVCLNSVCNQTLKDIEIICINDGSTDNSSGILQSYADEDSRIIIINQINQGASRSRNVGIQHAKGEYVYFLDSDDYLARETLETLAKTMEVGKLELLLFNANVFAEENAEDRRIQRDLKYFKRVHEYPVACKGEDLFKQLTDNEEYIASAPLQLTKRSFIKEHSLLFYEGIIHEDELFVFECLLLANKAGYIDKTLYFRRIRHNSVMDLRQPEKLAFSVYSCFICLKQMLQFCNSAELKEENEEAVFSNIERLTANCRVRYGALDEDSRMKVLNMTGKDKVLFRAWILTSFDCHEKIKLLKAEIKQRDERAGEIEAESRKKLDFLQKRNAEQLRKLERESRNKQAILQKELTKIKTSRGYRLLKQCYHARDVVRNGLKKIIPERKDLTAADRYLKLTGEAIDLSNRRVKENGVLLVEFNDYHAECLPGFYKYLSELNCDVDFLVHEKVYQEKALAMINCKNVYHCDVALMGMLLQHILVNRYKAVIFNSNAFTWKEKEDWKWFTVLEEFPFLRNYVDKIYVLEHQLEHLDKLLLEMGHVFFLTDKLPVDKRLIPVNCHWFGDTSLNPKNKVTRFISVGAINPARRNFKILLSAVECLYNKGITNFHITVIGRGKLNSINPKIRQFFSMLGRISYTDMYAEMRKSDFYLSLLDPENPEHDRYITSGTSGSFQLVYGFSKPCLIAEKFADVYGFTSDNAIVYKDNKELALAMLKAIDMTDVGYERMRINLIAMSNDIYKQSLSNLKRAFRKSDLTGKKASSADSKKKYSGKEIALKRGIPVSKRVTTRDNRVTLINYWTDDPAVYNKDWLYRFIINNTNIEHLNVFSLFGEKEYVEKFATKWDVFYSGENLEIKHGTPNDAYCDYCLDYVGLSLGFAQRSEPNYLRLPLWILWIFDPVIDKDKIAERVRFINQARNTGKFECSIIARHDKWDMRTPIYEALKDKMNILCAGKWNNNTDILWNEYDDNKIKLLNDCKFTICAENTDTPYYVTEKLFEAFLGGCVPIYSGGASRPEPGIVNPDAVLLWEQGNRENNDAVVRKACELNQNEKLYAEFISQTKLLPYTVDYVYDTFLALQKRLIALGECPEI